jgi:predicted nucleic acid-binding protein
VLRKSPVGTVLAIPESLPLRSPSRRTNGQRWTLHWGRGTLVTTATVFAELMAAPGRSESFLDSFFRETGISIDWVLDESVWRTAGRAFQGYAARRRKQRDAGPRRILADFLIGAHALEGGHSLLTLDDHLYRTAFPHLAVVRV